MQFILDCVFQNIIKYPNIIFFFAIIMIEFQNPRLQHNYKDDYLFEIKIIFHFLSNKDRKTTKQHYTTLI